MDGWRIQPLGELIENLDAKRVPVKESDRRRGVYPYYGASGIVDYIDDFLFDGLHLLIAEDGENLRTRKLPIAFLADGQFWVNNHAHVVRGNEKSDTRFLMYALQVADIGSYLSGSTMPKLTQANLHRIPIRVPELRVQHVVAETLGALDEKIEVNRRMNETLEALARAIYRDWFVDFGITRAKTEGRAPYLAADLWSLFPDHIDAAAGLPTGWRMESIYDQADWVNGAAYKNMHFSDAPDALPVIKISELKAGVTSQTNRTNTALGERYRIRDGELLFSWSGNPDTSIDAFVWTGGDAWLNQHIFAVRSNGKQRNPFLHAMLKNFMPDFAETARNKQTTGLGHVTKADMQRMLICVATPEICGAFDELAAPLFDRVFVNLKERHVLAETRDYLLPKLMSGEIRVRDAAKLAEEAA